jgi:tetratricopeptide (TPR) repeat protein
MNSIIEDYVKEQDFHAIATPLKSDEHHKRELKQKLKDELCYESVVRSLTNSMDVIIDYLNLHENDSQADQVVREVSESMSYFKAFKEKVDEENISIMDWVEKNDPTARTWSLFYGVSDETMLYLYKIVRENFNQKKYTQAKDLLQLILVFAPGISSYWNALGFCFQQEGLFDEAIKKYLIAKEMDPEDLETYFYLARCYKQQNDLKASQEEIDELTHLINQTVELKEDWSQHLDSLKKDLS